MAKGVQRDNLYREITDKIIAELEQGIVPWVKPWTSSHQLCPLGLPVNGLTRRSYSGINILLLWSALEERGFASPYDLITSPAFIVVKAADEFKDKTTAPNQLWQTDFTYLKVTGWGWFYLSTILDDFSRYIVAWKLCTTMKASDVTETLTLALEASGLDGMKVAHRPRLLSDNGSSYIASDLADWLEEKGMDHVRGAPLHPQTQGKIERWHQTLKNRILLENYYLPGDLEQKVGNFVAYYNHLRYHESIGNLTPADVYFGRGQTILLERERIKRDTIKTRRLQHRGKAA
jgi:hypothetical protein